MRRLLMHGLGISGLAVLISALGPLSALAVGEILHQIPCPGTDPRGLAWDGTCLWHVDNATRLIYKLNPADGAVLQSFPAPGTYNLEGLAWDGTDLWLAEYTWGKVYKINPADGSVLDTIRCPTLYPAGLAFDGTDLWTASYWPVPMIYRFSTASGAPLQSFASPDGYPWGVAWDGRVPSLWTASYGGRPIYELSPGDGSVMRSFSSPEGSWLLGIAYDGTALWAVDWTNRLIYQLDVGAEPTATASPTWGSVKGLFASK